MTNADIVFQLRPQLQQTRFYDTFYNVFMGKSLAIRAIFVNTNMEKQHGLLRGGILWLIMHARGMSDSKSTLLAKNHSRMHLNVHPSFMLFGLMP